MSDRQLEHHLFYACVRHFPLSSVLGPWIPISRTGGWAQVGAAMVVEVAREVVREVVREAVREVVREGAVGRAL